MKGGKGKGKSKFGKGSGKGFKGGKASKGRSRGMSLDELKVQTAWAECGVMGHWKDECPITSRMSPAPWMMSTTATRTMTMRRTGTMAPATTMQAKAKSQAIGPRAPLCGIRL